MSKKPKKTRRDVAEIARANLEALIGEKLNGEPLDQPEPDTRDPHAVALGRKGGLKGGKTRAAKMTAKERSEAAKKASTARWNRHRQAET